MSLTALQEQRGRLYTQAREATDEINANTDESRAAELTERADKFFADLDALDAKIAREERLDKINRENEERAAAKPARGPKAPKAPAAPKARDQRLPPVGTVLTRETREKGPCTVVVEAEGIRYAGELYGSLSKAASVHMGVNQNGYAFFAAALAAVGAAA